MHPKMTFKHNEDGSTTVSGPCLITGKPYSVVVPTSGFKKWFNEGKLIQDAMPYIPADDREFLMSGFSPEGWAKVIPAD